MNYWLFGNKSRFGLLGDLAIRIHKAFTGLHPTLSVVVVVVVVVADGGGGGGGGTCCELAGSAWGKTSYFWGMHLR